MYEAKIIADSVANEVRLTTMQITFPRFILAEMNTHRVLSRNSASSRAIPVETRIAQVQENPFIPESFGKNKSGMQASELVDEETSLRARACWLSAAEEAVAHAKHLAKLGVHKQLANRVLEPFCWHTAVITSTEWENFFRLRTHEAAQPEMQVIAKLMLAQYQISTPVSLEEGGWHLPYVQEEELSLSITEQIKASVVRCAAVSYERQDSKRTQEQIQKRHDDMLRMAHWSPFEHQAVVATELSKSNFRAPWKQYRKTFVGEDVWVENG